jgi:hypothetical protein
MLSFDKQLSIAGMRKSVGHSKFLSKLLEAPKKCSEGGPNPEGREILLMVDPMEEELKF